MGQDLFKEKLKDIEASFINPFITSMNETLMSMGASSSRKGTPSVSRSRDFESDVIVFVRIEGSISGLVIMLFDSETARNLVSSFLLGVPIIDIDEMAKNAIQEYAIRTCDKTKRKLSEIGFHTNVNFGVLIAAPLNLPRELGFILVPYSTDHGDLQVFFNLSKAGIR